MSLVAYGASDDSDASDTETTEEDVELSKRVTTETVQATVTENHNSVDYHLPSGQISDSDSDTHDSHITGSDERIPILPLQDEETPVFSLLKALPEPKDLGTEAAAFAEDDELEEEVKPKPSQMADVPQPPQHRKEKQPVKITIPVLQYNSDEEEEPAKKKQKTVTSTKCSLTSLLPAPVHAAKKESNRILLPYTLSKKKTTGSEARPPTKPSVKSNEGVTHVESKPSARLLAAYDSDSEDEDTSQTTSFFSLDSSEHHITSAPTVSLPPAAATLGSSRLNLPAPKFGADISVDNVTAISSVSVSQPDPNAPLNFSGATPSVAVGHMSTDSYSSYPLSVDQEQTDVEGMDTGQYPQGSYPYAQYGEENDTAAPQPEYQDLSQYWQDEEFLKLQGKKSRGREEISIVDVNADDFMSTVDLSKNLSEETANRSHRKKDGPSSQQKRKKQITYLAFQAQERELDLKNQWAQNRSTKRQAQSKYGF